jgi:hypothetical protein
MAQTEQLQKMPHKNSLCSDTKPQIWKLEDSSQLKYVIGITHTPSCNVLCVSVQLTNSQIYTSCSLTLHKHTEGIKMG